LHRGLHYKDFVPVLVAKLEEARVFANVSHFYSSLVFAGKAGVYQSGATNTTILYWLAPSLAPILDLGERLKLENTRLQAILQSRFADKSSYL